MRPLFVTGNFVAGMLAIIMPAMFSLDVAPTELLSFLIRFKFSLKIWIFFFYSFLKCFRCTV